MISKHSRDEREPTSRRHPPQPPKFISSRNHLVTPGQHFLGCASSNGDYSQTGNRLKCARAARHCSPNYNRRVSGQMGQGQTSRQNSIDLILVPRLTRCRSWASSPKAAEGSGWPRCINSIEMWSGDRTNAMRRSRGGRLMVTPSFTSRSRTA